MLYCTLMLKKRINYFIDFCQIPLSLPLFTFYNVLIFKIYNCIKFLFMNFDMCKNINETLKTLLS